MFQLKCIRCLICPIIVLIVAKISNIQCSSMFLILHKLAPSTKTQTPLKVQTIFLHQSTWYLAIRLTAAIMKCSGPLSAPALFQGSVRQPRTMFWRFEISQPISCFVFFCQWWSHEWMTTYRNGYDTFSVVVECWVSFWSDFQSGSRVLKKVL